MKGFSLSLLLGLFFLAGCTMPSSSPVTPSENTMGSGDDTRIVGNTTCDNYLHTIQCLSTSMSGTDATTFTNLYVSLVQSFKDVPNNQLEETCTNLSSGLRTHPTLLKEYPDCNKL